MSTVITSNPRLLRSNNNSGYRGISKTRDGRWIAQVRDHYKSKYLGVHDTPEEAAQTYDDEVFRLRGLHAVLNFPERYRDISYEGNSATVPVAGGYIIIDKEDVPLVLTNHCTIERISTRSPSVYIVFNNDKGETEKKRLAAVLLNLEKGEPAIFINGDRFDHRKKNLLPGKETGNTTAIQGRDDVGSGFKGVMFHEPSHSWNARIWSNGRAESLGYYHNPFDAAKAYDRRAIELWGDKALTNEKLHAKPNLITLQRMEGMEGNKRRGKREESN